MNEPSFFEKPRNINMMIIVLVILCALTVLAELFYENHHPHFEGIETFFGFQAWFGFIAFTVIVFLGRGLRLVISRDEAYYEPVEDHLMQDGSGSSSESSLAASSGDHHAH